MMDTSDPAPATKPADAQRVLVLQGGGALGSYQAGAFQALCPQASSRNGSPASRSAPSMPRSLPATRQQARRSPEGILEHGVVAGVLESGDAGRPRALAVQRDQRRIDRDLRRARFLHAADSAGAAMAAGQPAIAELLRHRAAEEDAGKPGRFRPHQRSEDPAQRRRGRRDLGQFQIFRQLSSSRSSARRSARNTSWRPARCRRAFPPS